MRIYNNCNEAIIDIGRELKKCATTVHTDTYQNKDIHDKPEFETKEIQAYSFAILDSSDRDAMPNVHLDYCKVEILERTSGSYSNPGTAYLTRKEVWDEFLVPAEPSHIAATKFDYTYSERMFWQLEKVKQELIQHQATRQAIIEIHDRKVDQYNMGTKRIPCSMFYQFMVRDGKLDILYVMRSTDFFTHFQNDIWLAVGLQTWMAKQLEMPVGKFIMFASSLHAYKKDWEGLINY